jgi:hypothetical protein
MEDTVSSSRAFYNCFMMRVMLASRSDMTTALDSAAVRVVRSLLQHGNLGVQGCLMLQSSVEVPFNSIVLGSGY